MYSSAFVFFPATALLLESWLGLLFSLVLISIMILRTALEDRTLKSGLDGYAEYAKTVKYRLVPMCGKDQCIAFQGGLKKGEP